ncbi:MAG: DnaJ domain-containing protein [Pleurocapsa sp.]
MDDIFQYYAILGIKHTASPEATKKAYRNLAKVWHPDRYVNNPILKAKAEDEIKKINQAYATIKAYAADPHQIVEPISNNPKSRISKQQTTPESYYQQGVIYAEQENYQAALDSFAQAIRVNGDYLEAYQYRGFILSKLGYKLRADAEFKKAHQLKLKKSPKSSEQDQYQIDNQPPSASRISVNQTSQPIQLYQTIVADNQPISCVAISNHSQTFASASNSPKIELWQLNSGQRIGSLVGHTDQVNCLIMSPSGQTLISGSKDRTIRFWDLKKKQIVRTLGSQFDDHLSEITSLAISPDNQILLSCDLNNSLNIWDINYARVMKNVFFSADVTCLTIHPHGQLFCSGGLESQVKIRQLKDGQVIHSFNHTSGVLSIAFSPDGKLLATGGFNCQIKLWNLVTGKVIYTLEGHQERVSTLLFGNDGQSLISGSWDRTIKLWDLVTGKQIVSVKAHAEQINTMAIAADRRTIVSGSADRTIKLWQCNYLNNLS